MRSKLKRLRILLHKISHKLHVSEQWTHVAYFIALFVENWSKYLYAKVGIVCAILIILALVASKEGE